MNDIMDTRDTLHKPEILVKSVTSKYKKGYLIYDQSCWNCYKDKDLVLPVDVTLPSKAPEISARDYCIMDSRTLKPIYMSKVTSHST